MNNHEFHQILDVRCPFSVMNYYLYPLENANIGNWHDDLEILFFTEGTATVISNGEHLQVSAGDTVIINPTSVHAINAHTFIRYVCLIINSDFCQDNFIDIHQVSFQTVVNDERLTELAMELIREYPNATRRPVQELSDDDRCPKKIIMRRGIVLHILGKIYNSYTLPKETLKSDSSNLNNVKRALSFIHTNYNIDISLDEIAQIAGMNKFYFTREFKRITGCTFVQYLNLVRCEKSKFLLLDKSISIIELCEQCGFRDPAYFSRVFQSIYKMSPSEFRKSILK